MWSLVSDEKAILQKKCVYFKQKASKGMRIGFKANAKVGD